MHARVMRVLAWRYLVFPWSCLLPWSCNKLCKTVVRPPLFSFDVETSILESLSLRSFQRGATLLPSRRHSEAVAAGLSILSRNGCVNRPHRRPTEPISHYPRVGCPTHLLTPYLCRCATGGGCSVSTASKGKTARLNPLHPGHHTHPACPILPIYDHTCVRGCERGSAVRESARPGGFALFAPRGPS